MKRNLLIILVILSGIAFIVFRNTKPDIDLYSTVSRISSFETASVFKSAVDDSSATTFPGTMLFTISYGNASIMVMNSLPNLYMNYDTIYNIMAHGNVTLLESDKDNGLFGIMPKHMFGNDVDLMSLLKANGFNPSDKGDIVTIRFKKMQNALDKCKVFKNIKPKELDGVPCTIQALNSFKDANIYKYSIKGTLHYLSNEEKEAIMVDARDSYGKKDQLINTKGLYVMKVPNELFSEIPGMSGGSVVVKIQGQDYFLGINTHRLFFGYLMGNDTVKNTMIAIQPVVLSDLE